jgi:hypothetical protein
MATYSAQTWDLRLARVGNRKTCSMSISCKKRNFSETVPTTSTSSPPSSTGLATSTPATDRLSSSSTLIAKRRIFLGPKASLTFSNSLLVLLFSRMVAMDQAKRLSIASMMALRATGILWPPSIRGAG